MLLVGVVVACMAGCASETEPAPGNGDLTDARDESFLGATGKADANGIADDSPEGRAVLTVVNESSLGELDDAAGLDVRAATNIVEHRAGADGVAGNVDDDLFDDLQELDAVPWVGPRAFTRLLEYAHALGLVGSSPVLVHGVEEGSAESLGVLEVANTVDETTLDDDAALDARAAANIVSYRAGIDGVEPSADDRVYESLHELDRISWVGARAFGKLLTFARNNGYVGGGTASIDPFDDALGQGTPITASEARSLFPAGGTRVDVGEFEIFQRSRRCHGSTGCGEWSYPGDVTFAYLTHELWNPGPGWSDQRSCFQYKTATWADPTGTVALVASSNGFDVELDSSATGEVTCTDATSGASTCETLESEGARPTGGRSCSLPNPRGSGFAPDVHPTTVTLFDPGETDGSPLRLNLLVTNEYAWAKSSHRSDTDDTGAYREVEYAIYASFDGANAGGGGTCTPTTCAAEGKNCGSIDDGCGGTLWCGSCSYPYGCDDNQCALPPGCNLQPCYAGASVSYTCCSSGQVTCRNGSGCTCYDACR
jgi:hypothetical protein